MSAAVKPGGAAHLRWISLRERPSLPPVAPAPEECGVGDGGGGEESALGKPERGAPPSLAPRPLCSPRPASGAASPSGPRCERRRARRAAVTEANATCAYSVAAASSSSGLKAGPPAPSRPDPAPGPGLPGLLRPPAPSEAAEVALPRSTWCGAA